MLDWTRVGDARISRFSAQNFLFGTYTSDGGLASSSAATIPVALREELTGVTEINFSGSLEAIETSELNKEYTTKIVGRHGSSGTITALSLSNNVVEKLTNIADNDGLVGIGYDFGDGTESIRALFRVENVEYGAAGGSASSAVITLSGVNVVGNIRTGSQASNVAPFEISFARSGT